MIRTFLLYSVLAISSASASDLDTSWHLLTKSHSGTITLLKNLTKHECEFSRARAMGWPATPKEVDDDKKRLQRYLDETPVCPEPNDKTGWDKIAGMGHCKWKDGGTMSWGGISTTYVSPSTIESAECFQ